MMRTRLLWFTAGFTVSGLAISRFVWRDILVDRHLLFNRVDANFLDLERRVQNLESLTSPSGVED